MSMDLKYILFVSILSIANRGNAQQDQTDVFQLAPKDVNIYFNSQKRLKRLCVPPSQSDYVITWWKGSEKLLNTVVPSRGPSINITVTTNAKITDALDVTPGSKVSMLTIYPVTAVDQGEYRCMATNKSGSFNAKFSVIITDACKVGSFKCEIDKKCILSYSLCDGVPQCTNNLDESIQAGCALPKPPEGLTAESRTTNEITLKWELVPLATRYQIEFKYPNNKTETFFKSGGFQLAMMDGLQPETSYSVRIRSETLTGPSSFSEPFIVKTLSLAPPSAPVITNDDAVVTSNDISLSWEPVPEADTYEIVFRYADGSEKVLYRSIRSVRFVDLVQDTEYQIKIRARSKNGFGKFATLTVKTLKIGPPGPPRKLRHEILDKQMGIKFEWSHPKRLRNSYIADLAYELKLCQLVTFDAVVEQIRQVPDRADDTGDDSVDGKTSGDVKLVWKKVNVTVEKYKPVNCRTQLTSETTITLTRLKADLYWYNLTTIGAAGVEGNSKEGNFTINMYTPTTLAPPEHDGISSSGGSLEFSGIIVFAIVTAGLCVILIVSFLFAWLCKWDLLMNAVDLYRENNPDQATLIEENNSNNNHENEVYVKLSG